MDAEGRQAQGRAFASFHAVWVVVVGFTALCLWRVFSLAALHDEGLLTWHFGALFAHAPAPAFFFQKARPAIAPLYAPASLLGFQAFATMHVLLAAAAIAAVADLARRYGHAMPVVAAFAMATSSLYVMGASAGHTNTDGVAAIVFGVWLWERGKLLPAGIALGMSVFMRSEAAVLVLALAGWAVRRRDWKVIAGMSLFPVLYGLGGALYHRDMLWMLHFPPAMVEPPLEDAAWREAVGLRNWLAESTAALLALLPTGALVCLLRPRSIRALEVPVTLGAVAYIVAIRVFPLFGWFNFDQSPRYLMLALPALALLVSRVCSDAFAGPGDGREGRFALPVLVLAAGIGALNRSTEGDLTLLAVAAAAAALTAIRLGRPRVALVVGLVLPASLAVPLTQRSKLRAPLPELAEVHDVVAQRGPTVIVTNEPLLGYYLEHRGTVTRTEFVLQADTRAEIEALLNDQVGQRDRVFSALDGQFYGAIVPSDQLDVTARPAGTLVVWRSDDRLARTIDLDAWDARTRWLWQGERLRVGELEETKP